ncbi:hypothetical protein VOI54_15415 [Tamlana sp. 2201CG12-4]|uniref:hypothetical protein n=1 Tax=Tamlana sp. 2201CG12-4 TaxID=3112582 RepID=UPI002DBAE96D|nr:hypothetical protein [Tamlana sp. 2201CG12-4]MEC3908419.1 hypothetical protein [Tamlana sp. 2201CG12-4]
MKNRIYFFVLILGMISCSSEDETRNKEYEFITEYSTEVTVGGVVGVTERTFEIGEIYTGTDQGGNVITIIISEHSELNNDCPNSWCYQELLDVPRELLKLVE